MYKMAPSADGRYDALSEDFTSELAILGISFPSPARQAKQQSSNAIVGKLRNSGLLRSFIGKSPKNESTSKPKQDDLEILAQKFNLLKQQERQMQQSNNPYQKLDEDNALVADIPYRRQTISLDKPTGKPKAKLALQVTSIFTRNSALISPTDEKEEKAIGSKTYKKVKSFFTRRNKSIGDEWALRDSKINESGGSAAKSDTSHGGGILTSDEFPRSRSAIFYPFNPSSGESKDSQMGRKPDFSKSMQLDRGSHLSSSRKAFRERFQVNKSIAADKAKQSSVSLEPSVPAPVTAEPIRTASAPRIGKSPWMGFNKPKSMNLTSSTGKGKPVSAEDNMLATRFALSGDEAFAAENYDIAIVEYSRAIDRRPLDAEIVLCRATALYKMGCYVEALADAMRAIGLNPEWPKPHYQLGLIYKFLGDYKSAVQSFRTALELEPNPPPALVALTLKAETVLSMPESQKSPKQPVPSGPVASALSFQPSGLPLPRTKAEFFSGLNLQFTPEGNEVDLESPLCSPSGGEGVSPFSFSSAESMEEPNMSVIHRSAMGSGAFLIPQLSLSKAEAFSAIEEQTMPGTKNAGYLALGMDDGRIGLWDSDTWEHVQNLNFHCEKVSHLVWSSDGTVLASASSDGLVCLWKGKDEVAECDADLADWESRTVSFTDLSASHSQNHVDPAPAGSSSEANGSGDGFFRLRLMLDCQCPEISALTFSSSGSKVATGSGDHAVRIWSVTTGGQLALFDHPSPVTAVAFSLDDKFLVSAGMDGYLRVFDVEKRRKLCGFSAKSIVSMQFCGTADKNHFLATCHQSAPSSMEGFVCLWKISLGGDYEAVGSMKVEEVSKLGAQGRIYASELRKTSEGGVVATLAQLDGSLNICSLNPNKNGDQHLRVLYPHKNSACLAKLSLSPCGKFFAGLTAENKVCLWSVADGKLERVIAE